MTCAACLSSAHGCALHAEENAMSKKTDAPPATALDTMGRQLGALVARGFLVTVAPRGDRARVVVARGRGAGAVHVAADAPAAVDKAFKAACTVDPALAGLALVLGVR